MVTLSDERLLKTFPDTFSTTRIKYPLELLLEQKRVESEQSEPVKVVRSLVLVTVTVEAAT